MEEGRTLIMLSTHDGGTEDNMKAILRYYRKPRIGKGKKRGKKGVR